MADIINLLSDSIANQIAAGEVVQRPASVVKELLENSIDSGAQQIKLILKESGKSLIQITDDGCGMSETDARMSFERHATSKIKKATDLFNIQTMGFRGEALASIASVSKIELKTKRIEDEIGTKIVIEGGKLITHEPNACTSGTTISVKNLFYNIPVRKNFLKSNNVEYKYIISEFMHISLAKPEIKMLMTNEGRDIYHLNKGHLKKRITSLFGNRIEKQLVPLNEETPIVKIKGFIGKPERAKKSRGDQFLFVNGRFIKNPYFNHAIFNAYDNLLPDDSFPFYILFLEIPSKRIDINVHPTKTEVKFEDDKAIYSILRASIQKSLNEHHVAPSLDFEQEAFYNLLSREERDNKKEDSKIKISFGQDSNVSKKSSQVQVKASENDWKELLSVLKLEKNESPKIKEEEIKFDLKNEVISKDDKKVIQIHNRYIFTPIHSGMMLIHQQYAHQRILFEEYLKNLKKDKIPIQKQMFPEILEFNELDFQMVTELKDDLEKAGISLEKFGEREFVINGIPANMKTDDSKAFVESVLDNYKNNLGNTQIDTKTKLVKSLAINAAIKTGKKLSTDEMLLIIDKLFACENPYYSPNGKPVFLKIEQDEIDRKFE